ncbi:MAG: homocysteine S-methyltransferase family protein, partial [Lachnospiraceae bacterium]|nr:homocysteine S-methyltransferase family protein [Lachnospiraceae bacterium]
PERWILENEEVLIKLQKEYVEAGTNILYAPTFSANRIKLGEYGLEDSIEEINHRLVEISRKAADGKAYVAGDMTMTGEPLAPVGRMQFEELVDIYKEQIRHLADAGVDLLVVETMMSLQECRAALIAAKETCDLPVMVTMTFEADGRALFGTDVLTAAVTLEKLGADAFGVNCSTGPEQMQPLFKAVREAVSLPLIAKPNAGMPTLNERGDTVYSMDPTAFATETAKLWEEGVSLLGGCCGTTPEHIEALIGRLRGKQPVIRQRADRSYLTSERKTLDFGQGDPFLIVGERINPTGKKKLQEELREGNLDRVLSFAEEQEAQGASLLDVNFGMSGIDEEALMLRALEEIPGVTNLPLVIDSSDIQVCEAALRRYPGRALLNSVSLESEKITKLLPIAAKYGAMFILLPLSEAGLPESLEEKIRIIDTICEKAFALGFTPKDIVVDGLVTTVGANPMAAMETLETIRYCREKGLATVIGLSNISFGLPERTLLNMSFLTMAIREGLTMAIANPSQSLLMAAAFAGDLMMNKKGSDLRYIERVQAHPIQTVQSKDGGKEKVQNTGKRKEGFPEEADPEAKDGRRTVLYEMVLKGRKNKIEASTRELLSRGAEANELLNHSLLPAINEVGELFDKGRYFLPQLIASAEAMKRSIEVLEPYLLQEKQGSKMPAVVIATVSGDIHDIGKNLVILMLKNHGFQVFDLGKDVSKERIIEKAVETKASVIGLSALMTTTMKYMKEVIDYAKERGVAAKFMIGGAVITPEYAQEIGAHGYGADAAEAVRVAKALCGISDH